jgi:outer membrane protein
VKKLIVSLSAVAGLLAVLLAASPTSGQGTAATPAARQARPHQIGLIDMAYVFNNYEKFKALQQAVQDDLKAAKDKAQVTIDEIKKLNEQLTSGQIKSDSPDAQRIERDMIRMQTELEAFGRVTQNSNLKREAEIYKQVYLEVQDAIKSYADHYGYTLIIRFDRESVADSNDPQQVLQRLTRQVVYHRGEDDLTMVILNYLNKTYASSGGRTAAPAPAAAATPAGVNR